MIQDVETVSRRPRAVLGPPSWFPAERLPRRFLAVAGAALAVAALAATAAGYIFDWFDKGSMQSLGYIGIFLTNFLPHVTLFFPLPGLAATGHALILAGADDLNPAAVIAVATVAMTIAEFTSYWAGLAGPQFTSSVPYGRSPVVCSNG